MHTFNEVIDKPTRESPKVAGYAVFLAPRKLFKRVGFNKCVAALGICTELFIQLKAAFPFVTDIKIVDVLRLLRHFRHSRYLAFSRRVQFI